MPDRIELKRRMAGFLRVPVERLEESALLADLVADSMILVNLVIELQEDLHVRLVQEDLREVRTVGELLAVFEKKLAG